MLVEAATGGDTGAGAGFGGCNMKVGFGERISTGVAIAGGGAGVVAGEGATGTETGAATGAADTIGLLTEDCTGVG